MARPVFFTEAQRRRIAELRAEGLTVAQATARLAEESLARPQVFTEAQRRRIAELRQGGMSIAEASAKLAEEAFGGATAQPAPSSNTGQGDTITILGTTVSKTTAVVGGVLAVAGLALFLRRA